MNRTGNRSHRTLDLCLLAAAAALLWQCGSDDEGLTDLSLAPGEDGVLVHGLALLDGESEPRPLGQVTIEVANASPVRSVTTDDEGRFELLLPRDRRVTLRASIAGTVPTEHDLRPGLETGPVELRLLRDRDLDDALASRRLPPRKADRAVFTVDFGMPPPEEATVWISRPYEAVFPSGPNSLSFVNVEPGFVEVEPLAPGCIVATGDTAFSLSPGVLRRLRLDCVDARRPITVQGRFEMAGEGAAGVRLDIAGVGRELRLHSDPDGNVAFGGTPGQVVEIAAWALDLVPLRHRFVVPDDESPGPAFALPVFRRGELSDAARAAGFSWHPSRGLLLVQAPDAAVPIGPEIGISLQADGSVPLLTSQRLFVNVLPGRAEIGDASGRCADDGEHRVLPGELTVVVLSCD